MADDTFTIKRGDTWPPLEATLIDQDGPIDLSTAETVKLLLKSATLLITTGPVTISEPTSGGVLYPWETEDTQVAGQYNAEFEITWETGKIETVPNQGYFTVEIEEDLG